MTIPAVSAVAVGSLTRRPWLVLAITCAAQFMGVLDVTIVNIALPAMRDDLGLSAGGLQWVVNGYALTFAGFLLLGGRAADLLGLKRVFLVGLALFTVASLAGGLAQNGWQLVVARAVQGLGGAILTPATLSMVTSTFPEPRAKARALGIWSAVAGAGGALGGVIGGLLTGLLSWRWVLIVNVPLGVVLIGLGLWVLVESPRRPARGRLDLPGSTTVTLGLAAAVGAIVGLEQWGWRWPVAVLATTAVLLLAAFVAIEKFAAHPLVPLSVFRIRPVAVGNVLSLLNAGVLPATFFFVSLHLQQVLGMDALTAGLAMMPAAVGIALGSVLAARLYGRWGTRTLLMGGSALSASAVVWLSRITPDGGYAAQIPAPLFLAMLGFGLTGLPLTMAATTGLASDQHGLAAGLLNSARQVGGAIGLAALVAVASAATRSAIDEGASPSAALTAGFGVGWLWGAGLVVITGVAALALPRVGR